MSVNRYDFDCYAFYDSARLDVQECEDGDYVLHSDYAALLARHNALRDAVAWERECDYLWEFGPVLSNIANDELLWSMKSARAEVDRLIANERGDE